MVTEEEKAACLKRQEEITNDKEFQTWLFDLRNTMNLFNSAQQDRIRNGNRSKLKKTGNAQKITGQIWAISDDQKVFNSECVKYQKATEEFCKKRIQELLNKSPIWNDFLVNITGIGPTSAGVLLSRIRPEKVFYVTNLYSYSGIVTGKDKLVKGQKATFDVFLKAKLLGVIGKNFIKLGSEYAVYYYEKRIQLIHHDNLLISQGKMSKDFVQSEDDKAKNLLPRRTANHHSMMAIRWMMQRFIRDYYVGYRTIMNIPVIAPYEEEKLKLVHVGEDVTNFEMFYKTTDEDNRARKIRTSAKLVYLKKTLSDLMIECGYKEDKSEDEDE